jgi:hypothetical protein
MNSSVKLLPAPQSGNRCRVNAPSRSLGRKVLDALGSAFLLGEERGTTEEECLQCHTENRRSERFMAKKKAKKKALKAIEKAVRKAVHKGVTAKVVDSTVEKAIARSAKHKTGKKTAKKKSKALKPADAEG